MLETYNAGVVVMGEGVVNTFGDNVVSIVVVSGTSIGGNVGELNGNSVFVGSIVGCKLAGTQ